MTENSSHPVPKERRSAGHLHSPPRYALALFSLALLAILSGCGQSIATTVTVYHSLPDSGSVKNYAFVPLKDQIDGIENGTYKNAIRNELKKHRYLETDVPNAAFLLSFSYGINEGRDHTPTGIFDGAAYTEYRRGLWVFMYENTKEEKDEKGELKIVYEGSIVSAGPLMQVSSVMPAMIEALFRDFPGDSGITRKEFIDP